MAMRPRTGSTRRYRKLRAFVLRRDGGKCQRCGGAGLECHHVVPLGLPAVWIRRQTVGRCAGLAMTSSTGSGAEKKAPRMCLSDPEGFGMSRGAGKTWGRYG